MIELLKTDRIVCAYARPANGPGWANAPLWVVVKDKDGKLQERCLQPSEQTREMQLLYRIASCVDSALVHECCELQASLKKRKGKRKP